MIPFMLNGQRTDQQEGQSTGQWGKGPGRPGAGIGIVGDEVMRML